MLTGIVYCRQILFYLVRYFYGVFHQVQKGIIMEKYHYKHVSVSVINVILVYMYRTIFSVLTFSNFTKTFILNRVSNIRLLIGIGCLWLNTIFPCWILLWSFSSSTRKEKSWKNNTISMHRRD